MDVLRPGQIFAGRYRVERLLAQGGFGAVFVAEQVTTELRVALKVLWPHILGSEDAVQKFQLEARVAARVNSEHIVKVVDAGFDVETGLPFLVMELLEGRSLEDHVKHAGALPLEETVRYLRQVALGLDKAHGYVDRDGKPRPIVHRDLKPENLFLSRREGGEPIVKILDFGIAKVLSSTSGVSQEVRGTPLFMAHEQAAGQAVTPRTDVWALGLIAFYLMTGDYYWKAAVNPEATMSALFGELFAAPIDPPSDRLRQRGKPVPWPPAFDAWFLRCVNREPDERFGAAGEAISALAAALGVSRASHTDAFLATAASPPSGDPIARVAEAVTANAMALSGAGPAPTSSRRGPMLAVAALGIAAVAGAATFALRPKPSDEGAARAVDTAPATAAALPVEPAGKSLVQATPLVQPPGYGATSAAPPPSATASALPGAVATTRTAPTAPATRPASTALPTAAKRPPQGDVEKPAAAPTGRPKKDVYVDR